MNTKSQLNKEAFKAIIDQINFEDNPHIAIALSGGADSLSLAVLLKQYFENITAITIDHDLRPESSLEAKSIGEQIKPYGIKHQIIKWDRDEAITSNIHDKAREARYELLTNYCLEHNILHLFLGHNLDDNAENFLIRLDRGSGLEGLSSIKMISYKNGIRIIRPLLSFSKQDIYNFLKTENINWIEDPSNNNDKYTRTKYRKILSQVKEFNPLITDRIAIASSHIKYANDFIEKEINKWIIKYGHIDKFGYAYFDLHEYLALDKDFATKILANFLNVISGIKYKAEYKSLCLIFEKLHNSDRISFTLSGCKIIRSDKKNKIFITREIARDINKLSVELSNNNRNIVFDNRFIIKYNGKENNLYCKYLGEDNYNRLKQQLKIPKNLTKDIIVAFPAIYLSDSIENIAIITYLDYINENSFIKNKELLYNIKIEFRPINRLS